MPEESLEQLCQAAREAIMSFDEEEPVKVAKKEKLREIIRSAEEARGLS